MQSASKPATTVVSIDLVKAAGRSDELRRLSVDAITREVRDYERFLVLASAYPGEPLAPTKAIDRIWHLHMLHPRAYFTDCMRLFGDILDHDGGFGGTPDEEPVLVATFRRTSTLWEGMFGEPYVGSALADTMVKCTRNCVSRCQRRCKSIQPRAGR